MHSYAPRYANTESSTALKHPPTPKNNPHSTHLRIRKVHLRMTLLEFLQYVQLALLIARRLPHLLLPLIVHHLLDHAPRLAV